MDKNELFSLLGGRKEFFKKVGIYLRQITRSSVKFRFQGFTKDENENLFALFKIWSPTEYRKGVKIQSLLNFFDMESNGQIDQSVGGVAEESERPEGSEDGGGRSPDRPTAPVVGGGGGG